MTDNENGNGAKPLRVLLRNIVIAYAASVAWGFGGSWAMRRLFGDNVFDAPTGLGISWDAPWPISTLLEIPPLAEAMDHQALWVIATTVMFAPLVEEIMYRMGPLAVGRAARSLLRKVGLESNGRELVALAVLGGCVLAFGLAHGSVANILLQGVIGGMWGILYLKNANSWVTSYLSCVLVHGAYNFTTMNFG